MTIGTPNTLHDPDSVLDYLWDWGNWLDAGETITDHVVTVTPDEEILIDSHTATDSKVTAFISGGVVGRSYLLTCHITTNLGREDDRSFKVTVKER